MTHRKKLPLRDPSEVPLGMSEEEREFWDTREITEEFLEKAEPVPEDELPPVRGRTRPISLCFDEDVLARGKAAAKSKNKGYQTLLKEFVVERLYDVRRSERALSNDQGRGVR